MPTKEEVIQEIDDNLKTKATYSAAQVKHFVTSVVEKTKFRVDDIKYGDVFMNHKSNKARPAVVIRHTKNGNLAVPLSTTQDYLTLKKCNSRLFSRSYFSKVMFFIPDEEIKDKIIASYDNKRELTELKKLIRKEMKL